MWKSAIGHAIKFEKNILIVNIIHIFEFTWLFNSLKIRLTASKKYSLC